MVPVMGVEVGEKNFLEPRRYFGMQDCRQWWWRRRPLLRGRPATVLRRRFGPRAAESAGPPFDCGVDLVGSERPDEEVGRALAKAPEDQVWIVARQQGNYGHFRAEGMKLGAVTSAISKLEEKSKKQSFGSTFLSRSINGRRVG